MEREDEVTLGAGEDERDGAVTLVKRLEMLPVVLRSLVRDRVTDLYDDAKLQVGADPCLLLEHLGIWPCPSQGNVAFLRNWIAYYPERHTRELKGTCLFRLLGGHIYPNAASCTMAELILPEHLALDIEERDLPFVQPHAPLHVVLEIFHKHHDRRKNALVNPSSRTMLRAVPHTRLV